MRRKRTKLNVSAELLRCSTPRTHSLQTAVVYVHCCCNTAYCCWRTRLHNNGRLVDVYIPGIYLLENNVLVQRPFQIFKEYRYQGTAVKSSGSCDSRFLNQTHVNRETTAASKQAQTLSTTTPPPPPPSTTGHMLRHASPLPTTKHTFRAYFLGFTSESGAAAAAVSPSLDESASAGSALAPSPPEPKPLAG